MLVAIWTGVGIDKGMGIEIGIRTGIRIEIGIKKKKKNSKGHEAIHHNMCF